MFKDVNRLIGFATMAILLFSAAFFMCLSYFGISDAYGATLLAKTISLAALAAFGQSEALTHFLHDNPEKEISFIVYLNRFGILLSITCAILLVVKLLVLEHVITQGTDDNALIKIVENHSEIIAFVPILYFSAINILMWYWLTDKPEIGRVCFVVSDLPVLMPMVTIVFVTAVLGGYGSQTFHLLVGGATVMFILVSIILNQCARSLLRG
jgi:hypothetical protein